MSEFPECPLSSLIVAGRPITYGIVQPGPDVSPDGIPLIRGKDYSSGKVDSSNLYHVLQEIDRPYARSKVQGGDILLSIVGYVGQAAMVPNELTGANITQTTARIAIDPSKAQSEFVFQFLSSPYFRSEIDRYEKGSAQPGLNLADVEKLRVKNPPVPQQRRIAEILSTVDATIDQTEALIAKYRQIKAGVMQDIFTRGVAANGELRPDRTRAPDLFKESRLGWIPREWEVAKLRDRAAPGKPHIKTGPFGSSLKGEHWVEEGRPVITIGALGEGELTTKDLLFVSEKTAQRLRDYQLEAGDVVFSRVADVGRSAVIYGQHAGWIMSSNLMRISLDKNLVMPEYLQSQFAFDYRMKSQIRAKVNSGGRDIANGQVLNQLLFAWPHPQEQAITLKRIRAIDARRRILDHERTKLLKLKQGLMCDLLTGRVRVSSLG